MSKTKFTPGPWKVIERGIVAVGRFVVAEVIPDPLQKENAAIRELKANAHLIAAAPELYKALEGMVIGSKLRLMLSDKDILPESPLGIAVAALAKARGEG